MFITRARQKPETIYAKFKNSIESLGGSIPRDFSPLNLFYREGVYCGLEEFFKAFGISYAAILTKISNPEDRGFSSLLINLVNAYVDLFVLEDGAFPKQGDDIDTILTMQDSKGNTLHHYAAIFRNMYLLRKLLKIDDSKIGNKDGYTPQYLYENPILADQIAQSIRTSLSISDIPSISTVNDIEMKTDDSNKTSNGSSLRQRS